jgi:hypothetical protein
MRVDKLQACGNAAITGSLIISEDLTVNGCVYFTSADEVQFQDEILQINYGGSASGGGLHVDGTNSTGSLLWDGFNEVWKVGSLGSEKVVVTSYKETVTGVLSATITHNLNDSYPSVTCWDTTTNKVMLPESITTNSANDISLTFCDSFTGVIVVKA